MAAIPEPFRTLLAFAVVLGVLVFVHELGHYLAARWRGVHVERFSIGFGRPLWAWRDRRGCEWRLGWIPLGGYVKLHGMEYALSDTTPPPGSFRAGEAFHEKSVGDRALIVFAGPAFNFLLAALLFALIFATVGRPVGSTAVQAVLPGSAAEKAGIMPGDRILALDGQVVQRFEDIQRLIQPRAGGAVEITLRRGDETLRVMAVPAAREDGRGVLGISGGMVERERLDPARALLYGTGHMIALSGQILAGVWQMLTGARGAEEIGGPLRIAQLSGEVADLGLLPLLTFIALLSINLALINLFPIPILDGGHLLFYAAEAIRGRPLPPKAQDYAMRGGFAVLIVLLVLATWNDLTQLGVVRWVLGQGG